MADGGGITHDRAMLDVARRVLSGQLAVPPERRARAAALLGRSALEMAIPRQLRRMTGAPIGTRKVSHQLICLRELAQDAAWARNAAWAYSALSSACHEHAYELEPNAHEVEHLLNLVQAVVDHEKVST